MLWSKSSLCSLFITFVSYLITTEMCFSWHWVFFFTLRGMIVTRCPLSVSVLCGHVSLPHTKGKQSHTLLSASHSHWLLFVKLCGLPASSPCFFWLFSAPLCVSDLSPFSGMSRLGVYLSLPLKFSNLFRLFRYYNHAFCVQNRWTFCMWSQTNC